MRDWTHPSRARYEPQEIEARRQASWREREAFRTPPIAEEEPHLYIKPSAPFTSGNVHIGHVRSYSIGDAYARFARARGQSVLFAFGFDAFGLPAELGAIAGGESPSDWVNRCAIHMTGQLQRLGFSFDWERSFLSSDPLMYRWSQWLFLVLAEAGLIYRGSGTVDWCDHCETTLASIQVEPGGTCWRCHNPVRLVELPQWYLRISAHLPENDRRLDELAAGGAWDELALDSQRYVLGRVDGVELELRGADGQELTVFTPHAEQLGEARFVLLSARHPDAERWAADPEVLAQLQSLRSGGWERSSRDAESVPVIHTGRVVQIDDSCSLPVYISPIVDSRYGVTAVLGVPGADHTDELLAKRLGLAAPGEGSSGERAGDGAGQGAGARFAQARPAVRYRAFDFTISRQRSWGTPIPIVYCERCGTVPVPREQLPVLLPLDIHPTGAGNPLAEMDEFVNTSCPACAGPARRETDTLDCHFDALWLWIPACVPPDCREEPLEDVLALADLRHWLPSERLVAGSDSGNFVFDQRIVTKALRDIGPLAFLADGEPFAGCLFHEMVISEGRKMSKHLGNVVDPDELVERYGADTVRLAVLYAASPQRRLNWSDSAVLRCHRFLTQVWEYSHAKLAQARALEDGAGLPAGARAGQDGAAHGEGDGAGGPPAQGAGASPQQALGDGAGSGGSELPVRDKTEHLRDKLQEWTENGIRRVTEDMEGLEMHSAVRNVMRLFDRIRDFEKRAIARQGELSRENLDALLEALSLLARVLGPLAPHLAEELWIDLGGEQHSAQTPWPGVSLEVPA